MLEPFSGRVGVVSWGMHRARFPWPPPEVSEPGRPTVEAETKTLTIQHPFPRLVKGGVWGGGQRSISHSDIKEEGDDRNTIS
jgi:hypothetical protein